MAIKVVEPFVADKQLTVRDLRRGEAGVFTEQPGLIGVPFIIIDTDPDSSKRMLCFQEPGTVVRNCLVDNWKCLRVDLEILVKEYTVREGWCDDYPG